MLAHDMRLKGKWEPVKRPENLAEEASRADEARPVSETPGTGLHSLLQHFAGGGVGVTSSV